MPLPEKSIAVNYRGYHLVRDTPPLLEEWLANQGYCLRLMSNLDGVTTMTAPEACHPLRVADLPEDEDHRSSILESIRSVGFETKPEGTFERGDIRIFVQSLAARDQMREIRAEERAAQESVEVVYEQMEEWNQQLAGDSKGGAAPGYVTADPSHLPRTIPSPNVAPVGTHASGGQTELARTLSLQERLQSANEAAKAKQE